MAHQLRLNRGILRSWAFPDFPYLNALSGRYSTGLFYKANIGVF